MEQRISVVTLGVSDLDRARTFYAALGWAQGPGPDDIAFFQAGGMVLALWDRELLAEDSAIADDAGGWGGVTLAHNCRSEAEVDAVIEEARAAGATIGRAPAPTSWGGYSGIFLDPDGHPWEVAHNPYWPLDEQGAVHL